ncbi:MAG: ROK family protein [Thermoleophilaceae bacterium]|nr:ROK family protein [Thermoleophilaceae bacterium]
MKGGVDLGGTKIQTVIVDDRNEVVGQARRPTPTKGGPEAITAAIADSLREAAEAAKVATGELAGVGMGSPGDVDGRKGTVANAGNLSEWKEPSPVAKTLGDALGTKVKLGNDVNVATTAEFELGVGRDHKSLLGVFWGTGVGGGLILNSRIWLGRGAAGEIGHVVVKRGGAKCPCGRKGCMEAYAGRAAMEAEARRRVEKGEKTKLFELMEQRGRERLTSGIWARALRNGDDMAEKLIDRAVKALGCGIASSVNLLDVEAVVIGGGLGVRFGETYAKRIKKEMMPHLFVDDRPPTVAVASLGDLGGAIGAALLIRP